MQETRAELVAQLVRDHNRALIRFLINRLRSSKEAADVAQEVYARMLQVDSPGTLSHLRVFLFKTAADLASDRLRRHKAGPRRTERRLLSRFFPALSTEQNVCDAEELRLTAAYIDELPHQYREALLLFRGRSLSTPEIAARLGISERTVRYYIVESLVYIRARLERSARPKPPRAQE